LAERAQVVCENLLRKIVAVGVNYDERLGDPEPELMQKL
jgi:hypothetical protein